MKLSKRIDVRPYLFKILDEIGKQPDVGWSTRWNFAKLAQLFVGDIDGTVVDMMRSHLELRGGAAAGAIAVVLNESDRLTALANVYEIEKLLREASTIDRNTKVRIEDALFNSAISGVRRGTYGQPFQEDIQLRDSTQEILKKMHPQSPAYTLYANLMKHATLEIKRERGPHGF